MQSADVFPAGRRVESLLVRDADAGLSGVSSLFRTTEARVDEALDRISSLERRLRRLETGAPPNLRREVPYVVFLATAAGYQLVPAVGRLPAPGERLGEAEVLRVGSSPLPGDSRPCVFAVASTVESPDVAEADAALDRRAA